MKRGDCMRETLCWTCRRGPRSGCRWFACHEPVPGWTAERRDITQQRWDGQGCGSFTTESYRVLACPRYDPDPPRPRPRRRRRKKADVGDSAKRT